MKDLQLKYLRDGFWVKISLFNLVIVALLGTLMRYKIGFEFPHFNQKFIQESHSHFAFAGWITQTLFFLVIAFLRKELGVIKEEWYSSILWLNLFSAYGMLVAFFLQGYGPVSIAFSVLSVLTAYLFSFIAVRDLMRIPASVISRNWFIAAIMFGVVSTLGTGVLAHMMATAQYDQEMYLGSVYFYLHFQYNGWFFFACMGILLDRFRNFDFIRPLSTKIFWLFFLSGIPTYFLSTLWAKLPGWLYILVVLTAVLQLAGWLYMIMLIRKNLTIIKLHFSRLSRLLLLIVGLAVTVKLLLQLGSTVPSVSHLAFSFRPIIIAYLHLVLLLITSVFLIVVLYEGRLLPRISFTCLAIIGFTVGAILNEMVLAVQGIASFSYTVIPFVNQVLFGVAVILLLSAIGIFMASFRRIVNHNEQ